MSGVQVVADEGQRKARLMEFAAEDRDQEALDEALRRQNRGFTQVYVKGWRRLQSLIKTNPSAARMYAFLAENIDESAGCVVVSQEVLASEMGVHKRTIIRMSKDLEAAGAIVRIRVGNGVMAYCLDPEEVWKSWSDGKRTAAFNTRTLVLKSDKANGEVRRKLKVMLGEPELQLS